jgi:hypothetical protein
MLAEQCKNSDFSIYSEWILDYSVRTGIRIAITECPAANLNIKLHGRNTELLCLPVALYSQF